MAARSRIRPAHWIVLVLVAAPAWKVAERLWRPGPRVVSAATRAAGRELFDHEWTPGDPLTKGDGLGPVFNARSCVECHHQGGPGGGGPVAKNVTVYGLATADTHGVPRAGVVHQKAIAPEFQETLDQVHKVLPHAPSIPLSVLTDRKQPLLTEVVVTQRNTPALFGDGLIDAIPDETLVAQQREHSTAARLVGLSSTRDAKVRGRVARLADGRIGRFGWKLEFASLNDFVKAACANELGLANPNQPQATPLGHLAYKGKGIDLTDEQCGVMADFIRALPAPSQTLPSDSGDDRPGAHRPGAVSEDRLCRLPLGDGRPGRGDLFRPAAARHGDRAGGEHRLSPTRLQRADPVAERAEREVLRQPAADTGRVADRTALGRGRLGPLPPRRTCRDVGGGDRTPRRRGGRCRRPVPRLSPDQRGPS